MTFPWFSLFVADEVTEISFFKAFLAWRDELFIGNDLRLAKKKTIRTRQDSINGNRYLPNLLFFSFCFFSTFFFLQSTTCFCHPSHLVGQRDRNRFFCGYRFLKTKTNQRHNVSFSTRLGGQTVKDRVGLFVSSVADLIGCSRVQNGGGFDATASAAAVAVRRGTTCRRQPFRSSVDW